MIKYLGLLATFIGVIRYWPQYVKIRDTEDVSSHSKEYLMLGLLASFLWCIYNRLTSKDNIIFYSILIGVLFQVYVLCKVLKHEKKKLKSM